MEVQIDVFLNSALDGGEWSASRPSHISPGERNPGSHWIEGWVVFRAGVGAVAKRKFPAPTGNRNPVAQPRA